MQNRAMDTEPSPVVKYTPTKLPGVPEGYEFVANGPGFPDPRDGLRQGYKWIGPDRKNGFWVRPIMKP